LRREKMKKLILSKNLMIFSFLMFFLISGALSISLKTQIVKPKIIKPRPKVALVRLSGYVTVPDGRKLPGVKIKLYEYLNGGIRYVKEVKTNKSGFYSIGLGLI